MANTASLLAELDEKYKSALTDSEFTDDVRKISKVIDALKYTKKIETQKKQLRNSAIKILTVAASGRVSEGRPFVAPTEEEIEAYVNERLKEKKK